MATVSIMTPAKQISNSAQGANAQQVATLPGAPGLMTYITGFDVTGLGATAALAVNVTVTGLTNTLNFPLAVPAGALVDLGTNRLSVRFPDPIPASGPNTGITVTVPAFGAGNTNQAVSVYGYQQ
jgi:hypothetical protein